MLFFFIDFRFILFFLYIFAIVMLWYDLYLCFHLNFYLFTLWKWWVLPFCCLHLLLPFKVFCFTALKGPLMLMVMWDCFLLIFGYCGIMYLSLYLLHQNTYGKKSKKSNYQVFNANWQYKTLLTLSLILYTDLEKRPRW